MKNARSHETDTVGGSIGVFRFSSQMFGEVAEKEKGMPEQIIKAQTFATFNAFNGNFVFKSDINQNISTSIDLLSDLGNNFHNHIISLLWRNFPSTQSCKCVDKETLGCVFPS